MVRRRARPDHRGGTGRRSGEHRDRAAAAARPPGRALFAGQPRLTTAVLRSHPGGRRSPGFFCLPPRPASSDPRNPTSQIPVPRASMLAGPSRWVLLTLMHVTLIIATKCAASLLHLLLGSAAPLLFLHPACSDLIC